MILTVTLNAAIDKRYVVEDLKPGNVCRVKECTYSAGGKGLNVSRVAVIAGEEVMATGFVGGHAGDYIVEALDGQKIKSDFVHISGESRSCINIYDEINHTQTEFLEPGVFVTDANAEEMLKKFLELIDSAEVVAISGSVPKGVDSTLYQQMIKIAREHHKKVILDTSGKLLKEALPFKPTMIKPNMDEIRMLTGRELNSREDLIQAALELQKSGIEVVVISCGADGSFIACEEGVYQAVVPKIAAVNTVGCGDSMIAGFAAGFSRGLSMTETIKLASAISAANAMRMETGFFMIKDMEELLPQIKVEKLNY
ncbi:1-phosphofructokinase [Anaerocolumna sp. AGMB13025]|uniref:1-phosphofructokinase n=1 Tax=Anaerocolumna sp. AGMB13025 TaxID=3039116 RepID=UPI00241BEFE5|nr:1-phosphofructokinase [Anaerocolumna sp. AGMB13025]WFR58582.1 1-phosphofructokinase [Anaerocolumna sp. AGMB13025]